MNRLLLLLLAISLILTGCGSAPVTEAATTLPQTEAILDATATPTSAESTATTEPSPTATEAPAAVSIDEVIQYEMKGAFDFFWEQANTEDGSPGYGLIRDRYPGSEGIASMASLGFGLTAYLIGIDKGFVTEQEVMDRVDKTFDTLLSMDREEGFYYHFVDIQSGKRAWESEVSSIDSTILLMGVLSAGEYFGGDIQAKALQIYEQVNWPWFLDTSRNMFYMAFRPEKGFEGHWDFYAEQLMMYVLAAGSKTHPVESLPYYIFTRHKAKYGNGEPFIHSWFGSIFTYQFSHAWIDFRGYSDKKDVNWFDNSVIASMGQYQFAVDNDEEYETLGPQAWGLSASDGPDGYNGLYGAPPSGFDDKQHKVDDTIPPYGAIGSILFAPEQSQQAMLNYYTIDQLKGKYGFFDAYNLTRSWFDKDVIGIDKGVSILMLANYENGFVYDIMMKNEVIQNGLSMLEITKTE